VYWPQATNTNHELVINIVTLVGTLIGQLLFGVLADRYGRQRLYGIELLVVMISTLGLTQCSFGVPDATGTGSSMSIFGWILFWRFIMGIGIGGEYPLSAVITSGLLHACKSILLTIPEWASTNSRSRMLAAVFIMQPLGQFSAYLVGIVTLYGLKSHYGIHEFSDYSTARPIIDQFWRIVTGLGAIPTIIALAFRLSIPESGRWTLDVGRDSHRAISDTRVHFGSVDTFSSDGFDMDFTPQPTTEQDSQPLPPFSKASLRQYFIHEGNWRYLAATSGCWALIDFLYYGIQINNPRFMTKLWANKAPSQFVSVLPSWASDPTEWDPITNMSKSSIYNILTTHAYHCMIAVSIGSLLGSFLLILIIPYIPRRRFFILSFIVLGILIPATGVSYLKTFRTTQFGVTLALFALCQTFFNLGPNSLTYIVGKHHSRVHSNISSRFPQRSFQLDFDVHVTESPLQLESFLQ
jgi:MFS transporter, PHS family, inorganic phosphate transporter